MGARNFLFISVILAAVIVYGSLYPFQFHPGAGAGALTTLLQSWPHRPGGADFLSNILLYLPLGFFCCLAAGDGKGIAWRIFVALACGILLSFAMELVQYYDSDRDTELDDIAANAIGTLVGVFLALLQRHRVWKAAPSLKSVARVPLLLLGAWAAYKLYPYVPVIDLHQYWHAIQPLLVSPQISPFDLFRHFATWSVCAAAIHRATNGKGAAFWYLAFAGAVLGAKIFIDGGRLSTAELAGAGLAFLVALALGRYPRMLMASSATLLGVYVVWLRLEPFQWQTSPRGFGWIPFLSLMQGSTNTDILSFLEKFFLYGGLIWLLRACGMRLLLSAMVVTFVLFATSWAERYLPGRSAEITDALLALTFAVGFGLLDDRAA